jgi:hypothetical protein
MHCLAGLNVYQPDSGKMPKPPAWILERFSVESAIRIPDSVPSYEARWGMGRVGFWRQRHDPPIKILIIL